jgi:hypothetical protein
MSEFRVGDWVVLKPEEELVEPCWKYEEVGVGVISSIQDTWCRVCWEDGGGYSYRHKGPITDLIKVKEKAMRTLPTKEQVLRAAKEYPQAKKVLEILFSEDFSKQQMFPDDCTDYGVFVLGSNLYIRMELYNMGILQHKQYCYRETVSTPPGYKCAVYATRDMLLLPDLHGVPSWIRTHDYGETP